MHPSGVTHITVQTDLEGIAQCLKWLSFVPVSNKLPRMLTAADGRGVYRTRDPGEPRGGVCAEPQGQGVRGGTLVDLWIL